jgi:hypothetical protein
MENNWWLPMSGLVGVVGLSLMTGCAAVAPVAGTLVGGAAPASSLQIQTQTSVRLETGNFVTVRTNLVGESKGFKLLGLFTFYPATFNKAMNRLYGEAQAEEGHSQTLANMVVEHSGIYVILFSIPRVTVRADLIEFLPTSGALGGASAPEFSPPESLPP